MKNNDFQNIDFLTLKSELSGPHTTGTILDFRGMLSESYIGDIDQSKWFLGCLRGLFVTSELFPQCTSVYKVTKRRELVVISRSCPIFFVIKK